MSISDTIFLFTSEPLDKAAGRVAAALHLERLDDPDVRIAGSAAEEAQTKEARAIFDELVAAQPDLALVLSHAQSWIVAAYLPDAGVRTFPPHPSLDADAIGTWQPWVVG